MTKSPGELKSLVRRFYQEVWDACDLAAIPVLLAENFSFRGSLGQESTGHEAFASYVQLIHAGLGDYHCEICDIIAEDNKVFARMCFSGVHRGLLLEHPATFRRVSWVGAAVFTFEGGRIIDLWVLGDVAGLLQQLE
jgi:steroid delta-isomerase-like uncharacterized protein